MKVQNVGMTNYQKQQNFGALKINRKAADRLRFNDEYKKLLEQHGLRNRRLFGTDCDVFYTVIPTRKGSKVEKKIMQFIGQDVESIGINDARKLVGNYRKFVMDLKGKEAKADF